MTPKPSSEVKKVKRKPKTYIRFSNGIEIRLPKGFHFEGKVTISGIVPDSFSKKI